MGAGPSLDRGVPLELCGWEMRQKDVEERRGCGYVPEMFGLGVDADSSNVASGTSRGGA